MILIRCDPQGTDRLTLLVVIKPEHLSAQNNPQPLIINPLVVVLVAPPISLFRSGIVGIRLIIATLQTLIVEQ